jgi:hypothetical protein
MGIRYSSGMSRLLPRLVFLALLPGVPFAHAARIEFSPPQPDAGTRLRITIEDDWNGGCAPVLESAVVEARDIVLRSVVPDGPCEGAARSYRIESERLTGTSLKLTRNGVYRVRHEILRRRDAEPELHGFRLIHVGNGPDAGFVPEAGFWWPERGGEFDLAGPGLGAQMEAQASTLSLSAFGYDAEGRAEWYIGAGPIRGLTAQLELTRLGGGSGPFETYRAPEQSTPVGSVHVEMLSPSRVTLWFAQRARSGALQLQPVSMVRFRFAQEPAEAWLGRWVVLAESDTDYPTRRIDFSAIERDERGFALVDAAGDYRLSCRTSAAQPNSPPLSCTLGQTRDKGENIEFRDIALNELRGWSSSGPRIVALKLNR